MQRLFTTVLLALALTHAYGQEYKVVQFQNNVQYKKAYAEEWITIDKNGIILSEKDSLWVFPESTISLQRGTKTYILGECRNTVSGLTKSTFASLISDIRYYLFGGEKEYIPLLIHKGVKVSAKCGMGVDEDSLSETSATLVPGKRFIYKVHNNEDKPVFCAFFLVYMGWETSIVSNLEEKAAWQQCINIPKNSSVGFEETLPTTMPKGKAVFYAVFNDSPFSPITCMDSNGKKLDLKNLNQYQIIEVTVAD